MECITYVIAYENELNKMQTYMCLVIPTGIFSFTPCPGMINIDRAAEDSPSE